MTGARSPRGGGGSSANQFYAEGVDSNRNPMAMPMPPGQPMGKPAGSAWADPSAGVAMQPQSRNAWADPSGGGDDV